MSYQEVKINIIGGTHQNKYRSLSSQRTINMYPVFDDSGQENFTLSSFHGQDLLSKVNGQKDRGFHVLNNILYRIVDDKLYEVDSNFNHNEKGIITGSDRCILTDDGEHLVIVSDKVYIYNQLTGAFSENTNVNLTSVISVDVINSQILYTQPNISFMADVGQPDKVSGLNGVAAESNPDKTVRDYVFNQTIYRFGEQTTELWYNSGVGTPPISRIQNSMFNVGLGAINSLAETDNAIYWLGDDNVIYKTSGSTAQPVSDQNISNTLSKLTTSDAIGSSFTIDGHNFYMITFPTGNRTFVVMEELGKNGWFELASTNLNTQYSGSVIFKAYDKLLTLDGGKILELKENTYTQDTNTMLRQRVTNNMDFGVSGRRVKMSKIVFDLEQGIGLISGQGENPRMMIEPSYDGGRTFEAQDWIELGRLGEHTKLVEWHNIRSFRNLMLRITISDPVPITIYGATIYIKDGGR